MAGVKITWLLELLLFRITVFLVFGYLACVMGRFVYLDCAELLPVDCADILLVDCAHFGTLLASLVAGASRPQGSLREPVTTLSRYRFPRSPTV